MKWTRPESVAFPQVWWTFSAKDPENGGIANYTVEDLAEDRFEEAVELMVRYFLPDEVMCKSMGIADDETTLAQIREIWETVVNQKITIVCFREDSSEICGINVLEMQFKSKENPQIPPKNKRKSAIVFDFLMKKANVFKRYSVDQYLFGRGLLTLPKYRGCGIATELLKARFPMMEALGLTVTGTVFTAPGYQAAAKKAGYAEDVVVTYESLGKAEPFVELPNIKWSVVKFMCYQLK